MHLLLDHQRYMPQFMVITPGKTQEIEVTRRLRYDARFRVLEKRLRSPFDYLVGALPGSDSMNGSGSIISAVFSAPTISGRMPNTQFI